MYIDGSGSSAGSQAISKYGTWVASYSGLYCHKYLIKLTGSAQLLEAAKA